MEATNEKKRELVLAAHVIAFEGYYYTQDKGEGETGALFRTIIHLLSKVLIEDKHDR